MDELIQLVSQKAGISPDQARQAVTAVLGFLKERLPAPIASQLDALLGGGAKGADDALKGLGGLLGKK